MTLSVDHDTFWGHWSPAGCHRSPTVLPARHDDFGPPASGTFGPRQPTRRSEDSPLVETFTLDLGRSWWARLLGRNPLVRGSDRIEAIVCAVMVMGLLGVMPVVGTFATAFREARASSYEQQAVSRHQTTALAVEDARLHAYANSQAFDVTARWVTASGLHVDTVAVADMVRSGERFGIWVDDSGQRVDPPTPPGHAATEAVGLAVLAWLTVAASAHLAVQGLRRRLNRARYVEWDRDLESLADR